MKEEEIQQLTMDDVVRWIMQNSDNEEVMDKVNRLTFTFTPKYKKYSNHTMTPEMEKAGREAGFIK